MKNLVPFLTMLLLLMKSVPAEQNTSPQIQDLENFALELGDYVKNDWCNTDQLSARTHWADFFNRLTLLSRSSQTEETILDFFKQTLLEVKDPNFIFYLSEYLDYINSVSLSELQSEKTEAGHGLPIEMARERMRRLIFLGAMISITPPPIPKPMSESDLMVFLGQINTTYPEPSYEEFRCNEKITKAIDNIHPLKLGSSTMFTMWNLFLAP